MAKRNLALDFTKAPWRAIRTEELTHYCDWRGISQANKTKLHGALVSLGARLCSLRFWDCGKITEAMFYLGVFWNLDQESCPDIEELFRRDLNLFCSYNPILEWKDGDGQWKPFSTYIASS